jgi:hypothetical protein
MVPRWVSWQVKALVLPLGNLLVKWLAVSLATALGIL